jgi:hypothetical protein
LPAGDDWVEAAQRQLGSRLSKVELSQAKAVFADGGAKQVLSFLAGSVGALDRYRNVAREPFVEE